MRHLRPGRILSSEDGFSLIELMGVAVIMIILTLLAVPVYANFTNTSRQATSGEDLRLIEEMLDAYHAEKGHYPGNLKALIGTALKPHSFQSKWSSPENPVYFYYAVNNTDAATDFFLADPGPGVSCKGSSPDPRCGKTPDQAHFLPMTNGKPDFPISMFTIYRSSR